MLVCNNKPYYVGTTRFNNTTLEQNRLWKRKNEYNGCIYGNGMSISKKIPQDTHMFVIEMNNSINKIEGIGVIQNHYYCNSDYNIYGDKNSNRFVFKGDIHIQRDKLVEMNGEFVEKLEKMLFKGKTHLKRGQGITLFPKKKFKENIELFETLLISILN